MRDGPHALVDGDAAGSRLTPLRRSTARWQRIAVCLVIAGCIGASAPLGSTQPPAIDLGESGAVLTSESQPAAAARAVVEPVAERLVEPAPRAPGRVDQHATLHDIPATGSHAASDPAPSDPSETAATPAPSSAGSSSRDGGSSDCTGYPEPRVYFETQDWWVTTPGQDGDHFGHVHVGTCFPYGQRISGVVAFDLRVVMHENPGHLRRVDVVILAADDSDLVVPVDFDQRCAGTCVYTARALVDTRTMPDGWQEFRFKARVTQPDGNEMITSSGWRAYLNNGNQLLGYSSGSGVTARGWYTDAGYQNAYVEELPAGPVSGTWRLTLKLAPGADGTPTTAHLVALDPNFHDGNPGITIKQGAGECRCMVSIDTTQLGNGLHRLFLRSDSALPNGSTHSGILAISFDVANP